MQTRIIKIPSLPSRLLQHIASIALLIIILGMSISTGAQSEDEGWSEPLNLSRSSGTSEPYRVVDTAGRTHLIWKDVTGTYYYSFEDAGQWSVPNLVDLPFGTRFYEDDLSDNQPTPLFNPLLRAGGPDDLIHALWTDDEKALFYSRVRSGGFSSFTDWSQRQRLAEAALAMDLTVDEGGKLHLVYLRPVDSELFPAGIYFRASQDGGLSWTAPDLLYDSAYFRSLSAEDTNLSVLVPKPDEVLVTWDHPPLERLYFTRSADGGLSWDEAIIVDQREAADRLDAVGPVGVRIAASADMTHLVWRAGDGSRECGVYTQLSTDDGLNWLPKQRILESIPNCVEDIILLNGPSDSLYLLAVTEEGAYLSAWDGISWQVPIEQSGLTTITDPETFRRVALGCLQAHLAVSDGSLDTLVVIGCDKSGMGDIWLRSQDFATLSESITPLITPIWQPADNILSDQDLKSPIMLSDNDGQLHAFWSHDMAGENNAAISYSRWDGISWSLPRIILRPAGDDGVSQHTIVYDGVDKILASWIDDVPGSIFFSQTKTSGAGSAAEWSTPIQIPLERPAASSPALASDRYGVIYLAYGIPLNEDRGIYLTTSTDGGEIWSEGRLVFDAVEAGWAMVDQPQIVVSPDGIIHLSWKRFSSPLNPISESVNYVRSSDGGATWSEPVSLVNNPTEWEQMNYGGDRLLHFSWLDGDQALWHKVSSDNGLSWGQSQRLSGLNDGVGLAASTIDGAGRPHLVKVGGESGPESQGIENDNGLLRHWIWIDNRWSPAEPSPLENSIITELAAAATTGGKLAVLYTIPTIDPESGVGQNLAYFSSRELEIPAVTPTPLPTFTPTPLPQPTNTPTPQPVPTPTISFPTEIDNGEGLPLSINSGNPLTGPLLGIIPAGLLVIIVFFIGARILRGGKR